MNTVTTIIGLIIGAMILAAGLIFFGKNKADGESRRIYGITAAAGAVIVIGLIVKVIVAGW